MLQKCPRQWFLHNYGRDLPGSEGRAILAERRLSYWSAFAGQLADDGITFLIRSYKRTGKWPEDVDQWLHKQALEYVRESKAFAQAFETNRDLPYVNHQVLMPYFFNEERSPAEHKEVLKKARESVARFLESDLPSRIQSENPDSLMCDHKEGGFPWAAHDGVPVYAVYDFAIRRPDSAIIFDWKTGKLTPETEKKALEQLHWYALYAIEEWGLVPEQILLAPVFLSAGTTYFESAPDPVLLASIKEMWSSTYDDIVEKRRISIGLRAFQEQFPQTTDNRECLNCQFRSCSGYARAVSAKILPEALSNSVNFAFPGEID